MTLLYALYTCYLLNFKLATFRRKFCKKQTLQKFNAYHLKIDNWVKIFASLSGWKCFLLKQLLVHILHKSILHFLHFKFKVKIMLEKVWKCRGKFCWFKTCYLENCRELVDITNDNIFDYISIIPHIGISYG